MEMKIVKEGKKVAKRAWFIVQTLYLTTEHLFGISIEIQRVSELDNIRAYSYILNFCKCVWRSISGSAPGSVLVGAIVLGCSNEL